MTSNVIVVRQMNENDLEQANKIMKLAFGTFLGLPESVSFIGDADYVHTRYHADPSAALVAEINGNIVGSNFLLHWGSVGVFGPLSVHPELWDKGVAKRLLEETMNIFTKWQIRHAGLFTFAQSAKNVNLYQKFGFWPRFLTAIMSKPVLLQSIHEPPMDIKWTRYSELTSSLKREKAIEACRELTNELYPGLDLRKEIYSVENQRLGDTILIYEKRNNDDDDTSTLIALAICHCGPRTEAGSETCYIKFGAIRPDENASKHFGYLLDVCELFSKTQGLSRIVAGANTARHNAYRKMIERNFRTDLQGVAMHRPNEAGYCRGDVYLIDDWR
ncbi:MAG TPA: GNAT family N-acetyltransferase [Nitrososphaera sp.]|jgi:GNAT superfamily N-acetyltransferase